MGSVLGKAPLAENTLRAVGSAGLAEPSDSFSSLIACFFSSRRIASGSLTYGTTYATTRRTGSPDGRIEMRSSTELNGWLSSTPPSISQRQSGWSSGRSPLNARL